MKQNKYDDEHFFQLYRQFPRSVEGLSAAGEWHELQKLLPNFTGKRVLDIGCGFGWHCTYAAEHGASYVLGTDISEKMLTIAKEKNTYQTIEYACIPMENLEFPTHSFDVVISSLAFHYTPNFQDICSKIYDFLSPNGTFVFSVEHPVFTAEGTQSWNYDDKNQPNHWPVDRYFIEGQRNTNFLGKEVIKYHKTLTTYVNTLLTTGFTLKSLIEPQPAPHLLETVPQMKDELRRPMMLLISAQKG